MILPPPRAWRRRLLTFFLLLIVRESTLAAIGDTVNADVNDFLREALGGTSVLSNTGHVRRVRRGDRHAQPGARQFRGLRQDLRWEHRSVAQVLTEDVADENLGQIQAGLSAFATSNVEFNFNYLG